MAPGVEIEGRDLHFHDLPMVEFTGKSEVMASFPMITSPLDPVFLFPGSASTVDMKKEFGKKMRMLKCVFLIVEPQSLNFHC